METQALYSADVLDLDNLDKVLENRKSDNFMTKTIAEAQLDEYSLRKERADAQRDEYNAKMDEYSKELAEWNRKCECKRCNGKGVINCYKHVDGGICFRCGGSKVDPDAPAKPVIPIKPEPVPFAGSQQHNQRIELKG